uniref:Uncharacterized protein n=1 Tax=Chromera velia CCMP2878 TaxID=1169474 RepID=A0A0K6SAB6_9ALVE|eukprot:Cvel_34804.t1-p1 / transcript=Cvel_34804.t1 / gene=Cvel_34804 / organism=Chromera_velia_CCMP2878 / gene_product=hypothetical protein / transcript_product=hypothetical protein / location=Cvel_scaffold6100:1597-1962(-) / protein_length=122 / sequence_SO=supercontig / SO=protein_coding / is_pseudo=false
MENLGMKLPEATLWASDACENKGKTESDMDKLTECFPTAYTLGFDHLGFTTLGTRNWSLDMCYKRGKDKEYVTNMKDCFVIAFPFAMKRVGHKEGAAKEWARKECDTENALEIFKKQFGRAL